MTILTTFAALESRMHPQPYIILRGGVVQNDPDNMPVLDLDVLDSDVLDEATLDEVGFLLAQAQDLNLTEVIAECKTWLTRNRATCLTAPVSVGAQS